MIFDFRLTIAGALMLIFSITGCNREDAWDVVKTRGAHVVEQRDLPAFRGIAVRNGINMVIAQGDAYSATIEGWKNLTPKILLSVDEDDILIVDDTNNFNFVRSRDNMTTVYLTVAGELNYMRFSGNGYIMSNDTISASGLTILCERSSGDVDLKVKSQSVYLGVGGGTTVASITIGGICQDAGITNWGLAPIDFSGLRALSADIHHHGPGNVYINASETLSATLYSTGDAYYLGSPVITLVRRNRGNLYGMN